MFFIDSAHSRCMHIHTHTYRNQHIYTSVHQYRRVTSHVSGYQKNTWLQEMHKQQGHVHAPARTHTHTHIYTYCCYFRMSRMQRFRVSGVEAKISVERVAGALTLIPNIQQPTRCFCCYIILVVFSALFGGTVLVHLWGPQVTPGMHSFNQPLYFALVGVAVVVVAVPLKICAHPDTPCSSTTTQINNNVAEAVSRLSSSASASHCLMKPH